MGRQFANLHIKTNNPKETIEQLKQFVQQSANALGYWTKEGISSFKAGYELELKLDHEDIEAQAQEKKAVLQISNSIEGWVSVLHEYLVWGTVKRIGNQLSELTDEPVMTTSYMNEELFEVSLFKNGVIQAERIFCQEWTRDDYELKEELLNDEYMKIVLDASDEAFLELVTIATPWEAVDKLSKLTGLPLWSDFQWIEYEEELRTQFSLYEFELPVSE